MTKQPETLQKKATQEPAEEKARRNSGIRRARRRRAIGLGLTFVGLGAFALFAGWAFYKASQFGGGWRSLEPIWPFVLGGCVAVGVLTGALMWLVFYTADHGYDDRV